MTTAGARDFPDIHFVEKVSGSPGDQIRCSFMTAKAAEFPPPTDEMLKYFGRGIDDAQRQRLRQCQTVYGLVFAAPRGLSAHAVDEANRLALALAWANDCLIWDDATRELFSPAAWKEKRVAPFQGGRGNVISQVTIHLYRRDAHSGLVREITLGMQKFACPDIVVEDVTTSAAPNIGGLINLVCQRFVESGPPPLDATSLHVDLAQIRDDGVRQGFEKSLLPGAAKVADLSFTPAKPDQGDPDNALLELTFATGPGATPQERQLHTLSTLFGITDHATAVRSGDPEMNAARDRARAQLPQKAAEFRKGLPVGERLMVKAPFLSTDGTHTEYMWVEVLVWQGDQITGILNSQPDFPSNLRPGSRVTVSQADVFDYIHAHRDGTVEGNETSKILMRRQGNPK
jgi:uncharacterized protein YegJ (DUF2314 family)